MLLRWGTWVLSLFSVIFRLRSSRFGLWFLILFFLGPLGHNPGFQLRSSLDDCLFCFGSGAFSTGFGQSASKHGIKRRDSSFSFWTHFWLTIPTSYDCFSAFQWLV